MAIELSIWKQDIQDVLYSSQEFLNYIPDYNTFLDGRGKTLIMPQSGDIPVVVKGGALPSSDLALVQRTDTTLSQDLEIYRIYPISLNWDLSDTQLSYDKRSSIFGQAYNKAAEVIGDDVLYNIALNLPTNPTQFVNTSGSTGTSLGISATGTRKKLTAADVMAAASILDSQNVPSDGRYLVLHSSLYYELIQDQAVLYAQNFGKAVQEKGVIMEYAGFKIIKRSKVLQYSTAGVLKDFNNSFSGASTDNIGCLAFQKDSVFKVMGSLEAFEERSALRQSDIVSFKQYSMGGKQRSDFKGICVIRQVA